ncbi:hypothetical protein CXB51_012850 [Gossypium anomalum]|uniref:RIN4 pathogenic type III effector avirulence factor Avr cleavage site domain-containing protein n=1 Tax=Gossypium anomalum TaxID=47600 RepID=A0A8J6D4X4_9ROSI|nr:hypothetical protein CXB51_012850 [Gossypium anomalum]
MSHPTEKEGGMSIPRFGGWDSGATNYSMVFSRARHNRKQIKSDITHSIGGDHDSNPPPVDADAAPPPPTPPAAAASSSTSSSSSSSSSSASLPPKQDNPECSAPVYIYAFIFILKQPIVNNPLVQLNDMNPRLRNLLQVLLCKEHRWVIGEDRPIPQYLCWCKHDSHPREELAGIGVN